MPCVHELVHSARFFFDSVLPQAFAVNQWTIESAKKSFQWAKYCQDLHDSVTSSGLSQDLERALSAESKTSTRPDLFKRSNMKKAPLLLLEEFSRNTNLSDDTMLSILRGMSHVFTEEEFTTICQEAAERKFLHQEAVDLIQKTGDEETLTTMKSLLIREDLLTDLSPLVVQSKLEPLTLTVSSMELLLSVLSLPNTNTRLIHLITEQLESSLKEWRRSVITSLLGCHYKLLLTACNLSPQLHHQWLQSLSRLASNLTVVYLNNGNHCWQWPDDDNLLSDQSCQGLWFSMDQLSRHLKILLTPLNDRVAIETRQFILNQCSCVWLEIQQQIQLL